MDIEDNFRKVLEGSHLVTENIMLEVGRVTQSQALEVLASGCVRDCSRGSSLDKDLIGSRRVLFWEGFFRKGLTLTGFEEVVLNLGRIEDCLLGVLSGLSLDDLLRRGGSCLRNGPEV